LSKKDFDRGYKSGFNSGREYQNKQAIEIIHKTIAGLMDNEDIFTKKDRFLLEVNKAICEKLKKIELDKINN